MTGEPFVIKRKKTKALQIGNVWLGGGAPIRVQSMTSTDTRNVKATVNQIKKLESAGCEMVRVAVPDREAAQALKKIKQAIDIPFIADIHFDFRLALEALKSGVDAIRINPGNMKKAGIREIVQAARDERAAIRIGVNAGSLEKDLLRKHGGPTPSALVESAMKSIRYFEDLDFTNLKISLKSSHVPTMIAAYRSLSKMTHHPLHLGVTEAGSIVHAAVKSSLGIGILLSDGIGDTLRVSVTGDPVTEMPIAYGILRALDIRRVGPDVISCPTCGRCEIDLEGLVRKVEKKLTGMKADLKIALMGCVVNGPGEAAEADIGIAGGRGMGVLFKKGKIVQKIKESEFVDVLLKEIQIMSAEREEST
jgi:(E)-4-hydroxy-3-methylbut-2-enyl-diphosphate synthase